MSDKDMLLCDSYKQYDNAENTSSNGFVSQANAQRRAAEDKEKEAIRKRTGEENR